MRTEAGKARIFLNLPLRDFGEANVRFGSKADIEVVCAPNGGHLAGMELKSCRAFRG
jgi:hypothetical protein